MFRYSVGLLKSFEGLVHVLLWLYNWANVYGGRVFSLQAND